MTSRVLLPEGWADPIGYANWSGRPTAAASACSTFRNACSNCGTSSSDWNFWPASQPTCPARNMISHLPDHGLLYRQVRLFG